MRKRGKFRKPFEKGRFALVLFALCAAVSVQAREIEKIDVYDDDLDGTYTCDVDFESGEPDDAHVAYFAWTDSGDKGEAMGDWENVLRLGYVATNATNKTFDLPPPANAALVASPKTFAARVFLAASDRDYDYFVVGTKGVGKMACYLHTGFKPQEGKTVINVDCVYPSIAYDVYLFGCHNDKYSMACYFNSSKEWSFACNDNTISWRTTGYAGVANERVRVTLDATGTTATTGTVAVAATGAKYLAVNESAHNKSGSATSYNYLFLWGRSEGANVNKKATPATIYSCVITNADVCVRDYRPAVKDGVAGMWDAVNNKFYQSAGTTAFEPVGTNTTYFVADGDEQISVSQRWRPIIPVDFVWTGSAGDGLLTSAGNWEGGEAPDFTEGTARLVFGGGTTGAGATVVGELTVYGIVFSGDAAFELVAADADAGLRIGRGGVRAGNTAASGTIVYTLSVPVRFGYKPQIWNVETRTELSFKAPLSSSDLPPDVFTINSPGRCRFRVDNPELTDALVLDGTTMAYRPTIYTSKGLGSPTRPTTIHGSMPLFVNDGVPAENEVPLQITCGGTGDSLYLDYSTWQPLRMSGSLHFLNATGTPEFRTKGTKEEFSGGITSVSGNLLIRSSKNMYILDKPLSVSGTVTLDGGNYLYLSATNNEWSTFNVYKKEIVCLNKYVLATNGTMTVGHSGAYYQAKSATLDLNGFDQRIKNYVRGWSGSGTQLANGYTTIKSATPASLEVASSSSATFSVQVLGAAGFHFSGTGTFGFTNKVSTTVGELRVSSGTVNLWKGGGWTATTNVVVEGTGTLNVRAEVGDTVFGPEAGESACALTIAGGGVLNVAAGETATVRTLSVEKANGRFRALPVGVYGGADAGLDAAHTLTCLSGAGCLRVLRQDGAGFVLILK